MFNLLGHVPDDGETVRFKDLELAAEDVQERRIGTVHIERRSRGPGGGSGREQRVDRRRASTHESA